MNYKTNVKEQFKKRFAELRAETGLSQLKLGKLLNLSPATIGYYENGDRVPDIVTAARIADHFSVSVDYLLGLSDVKSTEQDMKIACEVTGLSEKVAQQAANNMNHFDSKYTTLEKCWYQYYTGKQGQRKHRELKLVCTECHCVWDKQGYAFRYCPHCGREVLEG